MVNTSAADAGADLLANGAADLSYPVTTTLDVVGLSADAGPSQHLTATTPGYDPAHPTSDAAPTPTKVTLDGSKTPDAGRAITYAWAQLDGPSVTWDPAGACPAPPQNPAPGIPVPPVFPPGSPPFGIAGLTAAACGVRAVFHAPAVHQPTVVHFRLAVTDGITVATADTGVTFDPGADQPPVISAVSASLQVLDGPAVSLAPGVVPHAGALVTVHVAGSDPDRDPVQYRAAVTQPNLKSRDTIRQVGTRSTDPGVPGPDTFTFVWPTGFTSARKI